MVNPTLLARVEEAIDRAAAHHDLEELIGTGGRPRQFPVRTLLVGRLLTKRNREKGFLTRVHETLCSLPREDRLRLGVTVESPNGDHDLTYRQLEYLAARVKRLVDPTPVLRRRPEESREDWLARIAASLPPPDQARLLEERLQDLSSSILKGTIPDRLQAHPHHAIDWTDVETYAQPHGPRKPSADTDAAWGRRRSRQPGQKDERYFGYAEQIAVMVNAEDGPPIPELVRRLDLAPANANHPQLSLELLRRMVADGTPPGDLIADAAYPHKVEWTMTVTAFGFAPVIDLHPNDRGRKGGHQGATVCDGLLLCPATPQALITPPKPGESTGPEEKQRLLGLADERTRYTFMTKGTADADGYRRYKCPAAGRKVRCPLVPTSMTLPRDRPTITNPPDRPPKCCRQATITVPPTVADKTRQKHPYLSTKWTESYRRRTAAERAFATIKDPAGEDMGKGSTRLLGTAEPTSCLTGPSPGQPATCASSNAGTNPTPQDRPGHQRGPHDNGDAPKHWPRCSPTSTIEARRAEDHLAPVSPTDPDPPGPNQRAQDRQPSPQ